MNAQPRATVVLPAFDAASTIDVQLRALAAQRFAGAWELIVADNGSHDDTVARVRAWADRIPVLRVVDASARRGPAAARNIGAAEARGRVLLFCDADDAAEPGWMAGLVSALADAEAAAGGRAYTSLNRRAHGPLDWPAPLFAKPPLAHLAAASSHNLGVRADVFAELGGFDEQLTAGEDVDLCWRLQLAGHRLVGAPAAIMQVRRREGLRATYRQAVAYGRADALLARKYAGVTRSSGHAANAGTAPPPGLLARLRARGLRVPDPVHFVDRLGKRRGERLGMRATPPVPYREAAS
jgi:glycosyltransferase involved in cell wall biosynthesis